MFHRDAFVEHEPGPGRLVLPHGLGNGRELSLAFDTPSDRLSLSTAHGHEPRLVAKLAGATVHLELRNGPIPLGSLSASVTEYLLAAHKWPDSLEEWWISAAPGGAIPCTDPTQRDWPAVKRFGDSDPGTTRVRCS